ncbi:MAG: YceI family protein [Perlucidibaca sp.]
MQRVIMRLLIAVLCLAGQARADRVVVYVIDPDKTRITFNWTYFGMNSPRGSFSNARGNIFGNIDDPERSWAEVRIPVKTLKTFMPAIDNELLGSGDFFKPREFPEMSFRSNGIMHVDKEKRTFSLTGTLTVNGITKPVILSAKAGSQGANPFGGGGQAGLSATTSFLRSEFGMTRMLGVVGDEMKVQLKVFATEKERAEMQPPKQDDALDL